MLIVLGVAAASAGVFIAVSKHPKHSTSVIGTATEGDQITTLLAMRLHDDPNARADSLTMFAVDRDGTNPVTLFIPSGTLTQIPGLAFDQVGAALKRAPFLQRITIENILGIGIDRTVVLDDITMGKIIDALGGLDVTVEEDVYATDAKGIKQLEFDHGLQHMDAATAVDYMTARGDGTEIDRFVRAQKVWAAILEHPATQIDSAIKGLDPDEMGTADKVALSETLGTIAAQQSDARAFEVLPVTAVIPGGGDEAYKIDEQKLDVLVRREFLASMFMQTLDVSARPRVEIRNGNGTPEGGGAIAALLIEGGMRLVVNGNAPRFDYTKTKIIIYRDDAGSLALGNRLHALLGAGDVEISTRAQTVVDATIVTGSDLKKP